MTLKELPKFLDSSWIFSNELQGTYNVPQIVMEPLRRTSRILLYSSTRHGFPVGPQRASGGPQQVFGCLQKLPGINKALMEVKTIIPVRNSLVLSRELEQTRLGVVVPVCSSRVVRWVGVGVGRRDDRGHVSVAVRWRGSVALWWWRVRRRVAV